MHDITIGNDIILCESVAYSYDIPIHILKKIMPVWLLLI